MENNENFNSSDVEFSPVRNRFAHAGTASIASMRDTIFEDRVASKKRARTLTDGRGAPATQYYRTLWLNRLEENVHANGKE